MSPFTDIDNIPFDINVLSSVFPNHKHINEKAIALVDAGKIIRLKKGLYVASEEETGTPPCRPLLANHIYGPSYVSFSTALRHYGLIPEKVNVTQSVTTKHSRDFENKLGLFTYRNCTDEYFHIGVRIIQENDLSYLMASPEKALCDVINFSKGINLRFVKDVNIFLENDLRLDTEALKDFNIDIIEECAKHSRRKQSIRNLIQYIRNEYNF